MVSRSFRRGRRFPSSTSEGEFIGGCDIIKEIDGTGELAQMLGIELEDVSAPEIHVSDAAAKALAQATAGAPADQGLHLGVDARYRTSLFMAPVTDGSFEILAMESPSTSTAPPRRAHKRRAST